MFKSNFEVIEHLVAPIDASGFAALALNARDAPMSRVQNLPGNLFLEMLTGKSEGIR